MKSTRFWLLLIGVILAAAAALSAALFHAGAGDTVALICQDGECIRSIDLSRVEEPYSFTVEWEGGYNVISVERGRICVSEADCPDQLCVRRGWVADSAVPIACLPHHLIVRLTGGADGPADAIAG